MSEVAQTRGFPGINQIVVGRGQDFFSRNNVAACLSMYQITALTDFPMAMLDLGFFFKTSWFHLRRSQNIFLTKKKKKIQGGNCDTENLKISNSREFNRSDCSNWISGIKCLCSLTKWQRLRHCAQTRAIEVVRSRCCTNKLRGATRLIHQTYKWTLSEQSWNGTHHGPEWLP